MFVLMSIALTGCQNSTPINLFDTRAQHISPSVKQPSSIKIKPDTEFLIPKQSDHSSSFLPLPPQV